MSTPSKALILVNIFDSHTDVLLLYLPCHLHVHSIESPITCQDFCLSHWCVVACIYLAIYMSTPSKVLLLVKIFACHTAVLLLYLPCHLHVHPMCVCNIFEIIELFKFNFCLCLNFFATTIRNEKCDVGGRIAFI